MPTDNPLQVYSKTIELEDGSVIALVPMPTGRVVIVKFSPGLPGERSSATLGALDVDELFDLSVAAAELAQQLRERGVGTVHG